MSTHQQTLSHRLQQGLQALKKTYQQPKILLLFCLGFSAGLPYLLIFSTLSLWLSEAQIDRTTIGFCSWVTLIFASKWIWAPILDLTKLPILTYYFGLRRSWLMSTQVIIIVSCFALSFANPSHNLTSMMCWIMMLSLGAAAQETVADAYRIESATQLMKQATLSAVYQMGYRTAMCCSGAGVIWIVSLINTHQQYQVQGWQVAYFSMGLLSCIGLITSCFITETAQPIQDTFISPNTTTATQVKKNKKTVRRNTLKSMYCLALAPFADFFMQHGRQSYLILLLIGFYRISDILTGIMAHPFYYDLGFTKIQIIYIIKLYGFFMSILGVLMSGFFIHYFGLLKILYLGAILSSSCNFLFAILAAYGEPSTIGLSFIICIDNFSGGLTSCVLMTWLSHITKTTYSATQYAFFYSWTLFLPKLIGGFSGILVDHTGYSLFFISSACLGMPVIPLIYWIQKNTTSLIFNQKKTCVYNQTISKIVQ
ncbi:MAG: AmpG family muropeptide MFS transporter [Endozoicomonadaceae bacterium]|nr:AmpG family muropeptide MFS transporter [Endozoicomonadaceae bacterium]